MRQEVTKDDKEIVSAVLAALAARVGRERFAAWFGRGVELHLAGGNLHVRVGETFRLEYLRRSFRAELLACCQAHLGASAAIEFVLDPALAIAAELPPLIHPKLAMQPAVEEECSSAEVLAETLPDESTRPQRRHFASLGEFVVGLGNQVAYTSAQSIVAQPGMYSPLTFVGPPGCGKTHLLEGIWRQIRIAGTLRRVIYLSAEQFTNHFVEALKHSGTPSFRRKFRDVELLLVDDVQFLSNKQSTVVELVHTIDTLLRDGRQLVFSADRPPAELRGVGPELVARLSGGLVCPLQPADAATRLSILRQLAARQPASIPEGVLAFLAGQLSGDARHLGGAINRLAAASAALGQPVDLDFAQTELADLLHASNRSVRLPEIVEAVCGVFGVAAEELQSSSKSAGVTLPRMLVMFLARKYTRAALSEIGRTLGRRSHSTVVSAQHKVTEWLTTGKRVPFGHGECSLEDAVRRIETQLRLA